MVDNLKGLEDRKQFPHGDASVGGGQSRKKKHDWKESNLGMTPPVLNRNVSCPLRNNWEVTNSTYYPHSPYFLPKVDSLNHTKQFKTEIMNSE